MKTEKQSVTRARAGSNAIPQTKCAVHTDTELVCPKCLAAKGGATTVAKHGNEQMRDWGKLGGRPKAKKD